MIVQVLSYGTPEPSDPLGKQYLEPGQVDRGGPTWVDAEIEAENPDGTLDLVVGNPAKEGERLSGVVEGDQIGQFRRRDGGVARRALRMVRQSIAPLRNDSDTQVAEAAEAIVALFRRENRAGVIAGLVDTATDTKERAPQRVQALTMLAALLAQEVER